MKQLLVEVGEQQQASTDKIIVDGVEIDRAQFLEMQQNPKIKLKKLTENTFKKLERLDG